MRPTSPTPAMQAVLLLLALLPATQAFFIFGHKTLLRSRMDPIVNPGGVSSHVHNIVGASSFAKTYDYDAQRKGKCTTAIVQEESVSFPFFYLFFFSPHSSSLSAILLLSLIKSFKFHSPPSANPRTGPRSSTGATRPMTPTRRSSPRRRRTTSPVTRPITRSRPSRLVSRCWPVT